MAHWTNEEVGALVKTLNDLVEAIEKNTTTVDVGRWREEVTTVNIDSIKDQMDKANKKLTPFRKYDWWRKMDG